MDYNMKLVLKDGRTFKGHSEAANCEKIGELVFNTSMVGYQEIATDPSYTDQIVVMTYPLIGNYGVNDEDSESRTVGCSAFVVKEYCDEPSNFRFTKTFSELLVDYNTPMISGIDTRELTQIIRDEGSQVALITSIDTPEEECLKKLREWKPAHDQVARASSKKKWVSRARNPKFNIVCIDFGTKQNILREFNKKNRNVFVVPYDTTAETIMEYEPDGLFLSNGPGDPTDNPIAIQVVKDLRGKLPIFGICLGHQIISLACGAKTYKLKFGHRGANHAIKNLLTNRLEITSQNHSYAVDDKSIKGTDLEVTHINMLDNTIEGVRIKKDYLFSVQYHPEAAAGPEDSEYLFGVFIDNMKKFKEAK